MSRSNLSLRLGNRVSRLARIMQSRLEKGLAPTGLTRLAALVLSGIGDDGLCRPSDLAAHVGITRPALSRILRGLEARGLVVRIPAEHGDGRQTVVVLTQDGVRTLGIVRTAFDALQAHFAAKLTPDALVLLADALDTLAADEPAPTAY